MAQERSNHILVAILILLWILGHDKRLFKRHSAVYLSNL